jgi:hypothetical protein
MILVLFIVFGVLLLLNLLIAVMTEACVPRMHSRLSVACCKSFPCHIYC